MCLIKFLVYLSALLSVCLADCGPDGLKCCLTEFLTLVSPAGIRLSEQNLNASCKIWQSTFTCIEDFADNCVGPSDNALEQSINETKQFIGSACQVDSDYMKNIKENENCLLNSSEAFKSCFNKAVLPDSVVDDHAKWKAECCEYRELRHCTLQAVTLSCGKAASEVLQDFVLSVNGAGLEVGCEEVFKECNLALSLAPSLLLALFSTFVGRLFFKFS